MRPKNLFKQCILVALSVSFWASLAFADHQPDHVEGYDSYKKGEYKEAFQTWEQLANEGSVNAEYNLGVLYSLGQGVPQDLQKAFEWFHRAARRGLAPAQIRVATMLATATGIEASAVDAYMWFLIWTRSRPPVKTPDEENYYRQISELMSQVILELTDQDRQTAERRSRKWLPAR